MFKLIKTIFIFKSIELSGHSSIWYIPIDRLTPKQAHIIYHEGPFTTNSEMICGSIVNDNTKNSNNNTSSKQYISMINDETNNLLKQWKYVDVIELDTQSTVTDNLKIVHDRLKKSNKNINTK